MSSLHHIDAIDHTAADERAYLEQLAEAGAAGHFDGPTPIECYREPWASWPEWTDERWELAEDPDDELTYQRKPVPLTDLDIYPQFRHLSDDVLIDRRQRCEYPPA